MMRYRREACNGAVKCAITKKRLQRGMPVFADPKNKAIPAVYEPEAIYTHFQTVRVDYATGDLVQWLDPTTRNVVDREGEVMPGGLVHHIAMHRKTHIVHADPGELLKPFGERNEEFLTAIVASTITIPSIAETYAQFDLFFENGEVLHFHFDSKAHGYTGAFYLLLGEARRGNLKPRIKMVPVENMEGYLHAFSCTTSERARSLAPQSNDLSDLSDLQLESLRQNSSAQLNMLQFCKRLVQSRVDLWARMKHAAPAQLPIFSKVATDALGSDLHQYEARNCVDFRFE